MENENSKSLSDIEWEQRTLCSDESCIGVLGPDGRCKECGLTGESEKQQELPEEQAAYYSEAETAEDEVAEDDVAEDEVAEDDVAEDNEEAAENDEDDKDDTVTDIEWEQRTLCLDESCIGVIGPDGYCKECGLPYENQLSTPS